MTKSQIIETVFASMTDTDDPIEGAVFEKKSVVDFATFCAFILTQYDNVTMETHLEEAATVYLFYNGPAATDHIASYILNFLPGGEKPHGVFGGTRVGSENKIWNDKGHAVVENAFTRRER